MGHPGRSPESTGTPQVQHMGICSHPTRGSSPSPQDTRGKIPARGSGDDKKLNSYQAYSWQGSFRALWHSVVGAEADAVEKGLQVNPVGGLTASLKAPFTVREWYSYSTCGENRAAEPPSEVRASAAVSDHSLTVNPPHCRNPHLSKTACYLMPRVPKC